MFDFTISTLPRGDAQTILIVDDGKEREIIVDIDIVTMRGARHRINDGEDVDTAMPWADESIKELFRRWQKRGQS